jgi:hypothetical protein
MNTSLGQLTKIKKLMKTHSISITGHQGFIKSLRSITKDRGAMKTCPRSITKDQDLIETHQINYQRSRFYKNPLQINYQEIKVQQKPISDKLLEI